MGSDCSASISPGCSEGVGADCQAECPVILGTGLWKVLTHCSAAKSPGRSEEGSGMWWGQLSEGSIFRFWECLRSSVKWAVQTAQSPGHRPVQGGGMRVQSLRPGDPGRGWSGEERPGD
jgi:hypothetical protein